MKVKNLICSGLWTAMALCGAVEAKAASIKCKQMATDYDQSPAVETEMSSLVVQMDSKGDAESLVFHRAKDESMDEINFKFDRSNSTITHTIEKNRTDGVDEDTNKPIYAWGIENVEVIRAIGKDGKGFKIALHDHRYASVNTGSTMSLIENGEEAELPHGGEMMILCEGSSKIK